MTTKKKHNFYSLQIFHYKNKLLQWLKISLSLDLLFQLRQILSLKVSIDGWMDDLRLYVLFNSISVISGRCLDDNERLCAVELRLRLKVRIDLELLS